ncbi:olfactory receptor 11L1-like [Spea bombifrons]|uniref:olfactory receptor 11L1-like n=1 Tax=Spea bombifrons TaxID=233779 RepID=UPI00234B8488|nr:olfactory receptor 11L1-like [Spea bombifrons]
MIKGNRTGVSEFILLGFPRLHNLKYFIFILFLVIYMMTLFGNFLIAGLVSANSRLHCPMYFFLIHLSICDIVFTTNISPNMLCAILEGRGTMSFEGCIIQFYIYGASTVAECAILAIMSYDRYAAICNPLRYRSIMDLVICLKSVTCCWLMGFLVTLSTAIMVFRLDFCGPNVIDHFICDLTPLLKLSCSDTLFVQAAIFVLSIPIILIPFVFIITTYISIFLSILKIPSKTGRHKTFSTCSSHLTSVSVYYGTLITIYIFPNKWNVDKALYLLYTVVTPLLNPIIYSLRNQEMWRAIEFLISKLR